VGRYYLAMLEQLRSSLAGHYEVEREIGSGGMARIFLARDLKHRRPVAIKVLRPELAGAVAGDRFLREIEIAANLSHPHIIPLHDSGTTDGLTYYVMPYVEGESLRARLTRESQLPVADALRIGFEVADALAYAHGRGALHRDIKPENILLSAGHALVADFGIARALFEAGGDTLTATGMVLGTPDYMSPEQAFGREALDGRSDIYSLGTVIFEMLAGRRPFIGTTPQAVLAQIVTEPVPSVRSIRAEIPAHIDEIVQRSLAKEPEKRFGSAAEMAAALSAITSGVTAAPAGVTTASWPPSRMVSLAAAAAILVIVGGGAWMLSHKGSRALTAANRIAVLPFAVHGGPQLAYLGDGIVDLLSRNLEGANDVRTVDPGTVITAVRKASAAPSVVDAAAGHALARVVSAGEFVLGSVDGSSSQMRIQASLYEGEEAEPSAHASVEGDTTQLLELVDRLAGELLVKRKAGAEYRLTQTALLTTRSLPALKEFLNAEQNLRRRQLDTAIAGYQRAVAADSTFALAYYRLAVAAGWTDRHALSSEAVTRAQSLSNRLSDRDRRLVSAYAAYRRGDPDAAEREYRAVLDNFPDDLEAEFQLGDVLYQYNPLRGRPRLEARPMLDRVLAHDPGFL
jgi:serine/threonine-protein kinase